MPPALVTVFVLAGTSGSAIVSCPLLLVKLYSGAPPSLLTVIVTSAVSAPLRAD